MSEDVGTAASQLVDRVAKSLWETEGVAFGWCHEDRARLPNWDDAVARDLFGVGVFRIFARAAIAAMREPTPGMSAAVNSAILDGKLASEAWAAGIDAALSKREARSS